MASITVRNLDEGLKRRLRVRAAVNGRSMEQEVREILAAVLGEESAPPPEDLGSAIRRQFAAFHAEFGDVELEMPSREPMREPPAFGEVRPEPAEEVDLATAIRARFAPLGGVELELPPRDPINDPIPEPPTFE